jgi:hypothetical protein
MHNRAATARDKPDLPLPVGPSMRRSGLQSQHSSLEQKEHAKVLLIKAIRTLKLYITENMVINQVISIKLWTKKKQIDKKNLVATNLLQL